MEETISQREVTCPRAQNCQGEGCTPDPNSACLWNELPFAGAGPCVQHFWVLHELFLAQRLAHTRGSKLCLTKERISQRPYVEKNDHLRFRNKEMTPSGGSIWLEKKIELWAQSPLALSLRPC